MVNKMPETVIGVLENVQTKPPGSLTVKSCDLVFTDRRMLCLKVGGFTLVAGMLGSAVGGAGGAIAFGRDSLAAQDSSRKAMGGRSLDDILLTDEDNYVIEQAIFLQHLQPEQGAGQGAHPIHDTKRKDLLGSAPTFIDK